jgi:hypothetical protein
MGTLSDWYHANNGISIDYMAAGTGLGFSTFLTNIEGPHYWVGAQFQGWYYGVFSYGGQPGPERTLAAFGPDRNGYTSFCSVLGTGYYVPGVAGISTYNPGVYGQTENASILPEGPDRRSYRYGGYATGRHCVVAHGRRRSGHNVCGHRR